MKVAIIGGGPAGLACALECQRLGVNADLFERNINVGWSWPSMNIWPNVLYHHMDDPRKLLKENYSLDFTPLNETNTIIMKSPNKKAVIKGKLGMTITRGKADESLENQLLLKINKIPIHYNSLMNYRELASKYDYVVVATGRETEAKDMGLWEEDEKITIIGALVIGTFDIYTSISYFNTEYAGTGYGRLTPFNKNSAILDLYIIGKPELQALELFEKFRQTENLLSFDYAFRKLPPPFSTGRVTKFQKENVLLVGRSAGLVDSLLGVGAIEALISGVLAARAIARGEDYDSMVRPFQSHIDNVSTFRKIINKFDNDDFDKLVSLLGTPGISQAIYNTNVNFVGMLGSILKLINK